MFTLDDNFEETNHKQVSGYLIALEKKEMIHHITGMRQNYEKIKFTKNSVYQTLLY